MFLGEPGLLISAIPPLYQDLKFYKGTREINEKKIVRNCFAPGDMYFNFGDMLEMDKDYFVYFKDRIGDTFRYSTIPIERAARGPQNACAL